MIAARWSSLDRTSCWSICSADIDFITWANSPSSDVMPRSSIDVSFRTAYAQAKELALAQETIPLVTEGTVQLEHRRKRRFAYRYRYDPDGKRIAEYLGPEGARTTDAKIDQARSEIAAGKALA